MAVKVWIVHYYSRLFSASDSWISASDGIVPRACPHSSLTARCRGLSTLRFGRCWSSATSAQHRHTIE